MTAGELANAVRRALNVFDEWNDVSGAAPPHTSLYYELQGVVEDAVHCGIQAALGVRTPLPSERDDGESEERVPQSEASFNPRVSESELTALLASPSNHTPLSFEFGPGWVELKDVEGNAWARKHLVEIRAKEKT